MILNSWGWECYWVTCLSIFMAPEAMSEKGLRRKVSTRPQVVLGFTWISLKVRPHGFRMYPSLGTLTAETLLQVQHVQYHKGLEELVHTGTVQKSALRTLLQRQACKWDQKSWRSSVHVPQGQKLSTDQPRCSPTEEWGQLLVHLHRVVMLWRRRTSFNVDVNLKISLRWESWRLHSAIHFQVQNQNISFRITSTWENNEKPENDNLTLQIIYLRYWG